MLDTAKAFALGVLVTVLIVGPHPAGGGVTKTAAILIAITVLPVFVWDLYHTNRKENK